MADMKTTGRTIRRATPDERDELVALLNDQFLPGTERIAFDKRLPHLFTEARMPNNFVCVDDGKIVGNIGIYPFGFQAKGIAFNGAGIGQVVTHADYRGTGIMGDIMKHVTAEANRYDFSWLYGDRKRYSRYGWTPGGNMQTYRTYDRYLPELPRNLAVEAPEPEAIIERIMSLFSSAVASVIMEKEELLQLLHGQGIRCVTYQSALLLTNAEGSTVHAGEGNTEDMALLFKWLCDRQREREGDYWNIGITIPDGDSELRRACLKHFWEVQTDPSASLRVGNLHGFLEKICRLNQPAVTTGNETITFANTENGEEASLVCREGVLSVSDKAGGLRVERSPKELSGLFFGPVNRLDTVEGLRPDSPLHRMFPVTFGVSHLFAV